MPLDFLVKKDRKADETIQCKTGKDFYTFTI